MNVQDNGTPSVDGGFTLEIIGFNIESCRIAQAAGAHRIELCDNPLEGGSTPSYGFLKAARQLLHMFRDLRERNLVAVCG